MCYILREAYNSICTWCWDQYLYAVRGSACWSEQHCVDRQDHALGVSKKQTCHNTIQWQDGIWALVQTDPVSVLDVFAAAAHRSNGCTLDDCIIGWCRSTSCDVGACYWHERWLCLHGKLVLKWFLKVPAFKKQSMAALHDMKLRIEEMAIGAMTLNLIGSSCLASCSCSVWYEWHVNLFPVHGTLRYHKVKHRQLEL